MNGGGIYQNPLLEQFLRYATRDKLGEYGPDAPDAPPAAEISEWSAAELDSVAGLYAGMMGVSRVIADGAAGAIDLQVNVQSGSPLEIGDLLPHDDGWFFDPAAPDFALSFTNVLDQTLLLTRHVRDGGVQEILFGQRFEPVPLSTTWSNRAATWLAVDSFPGDYYSALELDSCEITIHDGVLYMYGSTALLPVSDDLAFAPFYGLRNLGALRFDPLDGQSLLYGDIRLQRLDQQPLLAQGASHAGSIEGDESQFFRIPVSAGDSFVVDLDSAHDIQAAIYQDGTAVGIAGPAQAMRISSAEAGEIVLKVQRNGPQTGDYRLSIHSNSLPFFAEVEPADWPAPLADKAHLFPDSDFGHVFVHAQRSDPSGRVLKIAVVRMNADAPTAPALFFCNGGPGDSSIISVYQRYLKAFTDEYDVYLVDQRGVNLSQPRLARREGETLAEFQYRLSMLEDAELAAINTIESSYDIEDVATAFGLNDVNLLGQSYGAMLSQTLMRREPAWLRAVVLDGVAAPNIPSISNAGTVMRDAVAALAQDAAGIPWYAGLEDEYYELAAALRDEPLQLEIDGGALSFDDDLFFQLTLGHLSESDIGLRERLPNIVWRALRGEKAALGDLFNSNFDPATTMNDAVNACMAALILRHDFLPFNSRAAITNACAGLREPLRSYAIDYSGAIIDSAAALEDYGQVGPEFALPVTSAIPTLVINGHYDTQTGNDWAAEVAAHLPNSHLVLLPTVGHGVLQGGQYPLQIIREFLADPSRPPDLDLLDNLALDYPDPWPSEAPFLAAGAALSGAIDAGGAAQWFAVQADPPAAPLGNVSNLVYQFSASSLPAGFQARLYDASDGSAITGRTGSGSFSFESSANQLLLAVHPGSDGDQSGSYMIDLGIPLLVRAISGIPPELEIVWQAPTGMVARIEAATELGAADAFAPLLPGISASKPLQRSSIPATDDAVQFYRLIETVSE
jgi:pimeloyl-ACP methyl ester carboxylesterase